MSKVSGQVQEKAWQPTVGQTASQAFAVRPFPEIAKKEDGKEASGDRTETIDAKQGAAIANINRAIASVNEDRQIKAIINNLKNEEIKRCSKEKKEEENHDRDTPNNIPSASSKTVSDHFKKNSEIFVMDTKPTNWSQDWTMDSNKLPPTYWKKEWDWKHRLNEK